MSVRLERFRIAGLHGYQDMDIPINDNRLIIVGENGSGKSTIANLIFSFLSREWHRLFSYQFDWVSITLNGEEIRLNRADLVATVSKHSAERITRFPRAVQRAIDEIQQFEGLSIHISEKYGLPVDLVFEHLSEDESLFAIQKRINELVEDQILYLPTYRRIEKDLQYLFDDDDIRQRNRRFGNPTARDKKPFIELIKFGMQDVDQIIQETLRDLRENLRKSLNDLTGNYLREVIQGEYETVNVEQLRDLSEETINDLLDRVGGNFLSIHEEKNLRNIVDKIKDNHEILEHDKVIIHFLIRLIELHEHQQEKEKDVRNFVKVCNRYLIGKQLIYDSTHYEITITPDISNTNRDKTTKANLSQLSSGEKQIVSLFSHIYLSGQSSYFVVIDEPELSLSVTWQKQFLPDIWETGKCNGIVAVTHSPFIFENDFDRYTYGIEEFRVQP